jgi:SRSO17 transposase
MAARLAPDQVRRMHQSLHHVVPDAAWSDRNLLSAVWQWVWPAMKSQGPMVAWEVDDTGLPKKGRHSVGVARQYCGQVGKQDNCQVAVSLWVSTQHSSLPVAYDLYLPESWVSDKKRRSAAKVPEEIEFRTKPFIAAEQIREALKEGVPTARVLADAAYGSDSKFREALSGMGLDYLVGIQSTLSVWPPGMEPLKPKEWKGKGRRPKLLQRSAEHQPIPVEDLALGLPASVWKKISWRKGTKEALRSRFAAVRIRPAHRDMCSTEPWPEQWVLVEWPTTEVKPTKYWLGTMPATIGLKELVALAKHRWIIERDYLVLGDQAADEIPLEDATRLCREAL